jgi:hypothetical protein
MRCEPCQRDEHRDCTRRDAEGFCCCVQDERKAARGWLTRLWRRVRGLCIECGEYTPSGRLCLTHRNALHVWALRRA